MSDLSDIASATIVDAWNKGEEHERNRQRAQLALLREQVRSLPVNSEDGLWVRTQAIRLIDEVPTVSPAPETGGAVHIQRLPASSGAGPNAAAGGESGAA